MFALKSSPIIFFEQLIFANPGQQSVNTID